MTPDSATIREWREAYLASLRLDAAAAERERIREIVLDMEGFGGFQGDGDFVCRQGVIDEIDKVEGA
jgi:hypothetical protein